MKPLADVLGGVKEAEESAAAAKERRIAELDEASEAIRAGEDTTGDLFQDGLVAIYGGDLVRSPQIVANYQHVAEALRGKVGEPVLIIRRWMDAVSTGFDPMMSVFEARTMGILSTEDMIFDYADRSVSLPTAKYVREGRDRGMSGRKIELHEGNIRVGYGQPSVKFDWSRSGFDLGHELTDELNDDNRRLMNTLPEDRRSLIVLVGQAEIDIYLAAQGFVHNPFMIVRQMAIRLGAKPPEPATGSREARWLEDQRTSLLERRAAILADRDAKQAEVAKTDKALADLKREAKQLGVKLD